MLFWFISLLMLAVAVMCVLLPMSRDIDKQSADADPVEVYKQQLKELESETETSPVSEEVLAARRTEIGRRILRESRAGSTAGTAREKSSTLVKSTSIISIIAIPLIAVGTYFSTGSPESATWPVASDTAQPLSEKSIDEMVMIAERHLEKNPQDARGWEVLAGVYGRMNRPADRARALQELIRLSGRSPERLADLGEALTVAGGNIVPVRARQLFEEALRLQADQPKASLFMAIALEQEGRFDEALTRWQKLETERGNDPRWKAMIDGKVSELRVKMGAPVSPGPTEEDVANAANLSTGERQAMIESMVAGLAAKLDESPEDYSGWNRLIRSYMVLKKPELALAALKKASSQFQTEPEKVKQLQELEKQIENAADEQGTVSQ